MQISATNLLLAAQQQAQPRAPARSQPAPARFEPADFGDVLGDAAPAAQAVKTPAPSPPVSLAAGATAMGSLLDIKV